MELSRCKQLQIAMTPSEWNETDQKPQTRAIK